MPETLRIGQLAAGAGVNVETLRFYERRGLLESPRRRPASGYREYPEEAVGVVRFIKRTQELGFTLREIQELLGLRENRGASCAEVRSAAAGKLEDIERKLKSLRAMRRALAMLVESCSSEGSPRHCPILEALDDSRGRS